MSEFEKELAVDNDDKLEQLLSHASPRTMPDDVANAAARRAVHAEWRKVTGQRQRRQHVVNFALAASILVAVFSLFSVFRPAVVDVVQVASVQKSFGATNFLGEQSVLTPVENGIAVHQGQTIVTEEDAGMALAWHGGGSVRLDKNTKVEFESDGSIYLHFGKVYFDSQPSELIAGIQAAGVAAFVVATDHGTVTHVGTQFMTEVAPDAMTVSVREGRVSVDGQFSEQYASRGERLEFVGGQQPTKLSIGEYGDEWAWIGETSPAIDVDGKTVATFLTWVHRETGFEIDYANDAVKQIAEDTRLAGQIDMEPMAALPLWMMTTKLVYERKGGMIYVYKSQ